MTYAIGSIVYGINYKDIEENPDKYAATENDVEALVDGDLLVREYSGNGDAPTYLGVRLGSIDECNDVALAELIKIGRKADDVKVIAEFSQMKIQLLEDEELSQGFKDKLNDMNPVVFVTWGSS